MAKNIQDRPIDYKLFSDADLRAEAARVNVDVSACTSKKQIASVLNGDQPTTDGNGSTDDGNGSTDNGAIDLNKIDAPNMAVGTVLEHKDRGGVVKCTATKQADGTWITDFTSDAFTSLSKLAGAYSKHVGNTNDSINGRKFFGLAPLTVGTSRAGTGTGLPRGKSRDALVARRDKLVAMIDDLKAKLADADKAIVDHDLSATHEAEIEAELADVKARFEAEMAVAKEKALAKIAARSTVNQ